jgi:oligopeptide transport system substrate-binding protein
MYESSAIDLMYTGALSPEISNRLIQLNSDEYLSSPGGSTVILTFDTSKPPFNDPRVRQALIMAIDYQTIVGRAVKGSVLPAGGGLTPPGIPGHIPDLDRPTDLRNARKLLAEAGYPGGEGFPRLTALIQHSINKGDYFGAFVAGWKSTLGIDIGYEALEFNEYLSRVDEKTPPMWLGSWGADYPDPDSFLNAANWLKLSGWRHKEYEALIRDAQGISNQGQRLAMYRQAERIIAQEMPAVPLSYGRDRLLIKPWVSALPISVIRGPILDEIVIDHH